MTQSTSKQQAEIFLAECEQFRLGGLTTEDAHSVTRDLSATAAESITDALRLLFDVDADVIDTYAKWIETSAPGRIAEIVLECLGSGHNVYFTGCGATGRLSILLESIWREFWVSSSRPESGTWQDRVKSVMSGGDFALIKSVEGFEDFAQFGAKQIGDMGVSAGDVVFAITEGGETSFVIGTAWKGLEVGAKVYFVYNNPDETLRANVTRSREIIDEPRIEKINLTTGPMAIMGSTRMQATSIQLCAMITIMEMVVHQICGGSGNNIAPRDSPAGANPCIPSSPQGVSMDDSITVPQRFLASLEQMHSTLNSASVRSQLAEIVRIEEQTYAGGHKSTYFADVLGIDVLTDTTERSPTFCTPPFRKWDDPSASESWTYLILPHADSKSAWEGLLKRPPYGLTWTDDEIARLVDADIAPRQSQIMRQIGPEEILRFRIGLDGLISRPMQTGDVAVCVVTEGEKDSLLSENGFFRTQLEAASRVGAYLALIFVGRGSAVEEIRGFLESWDADCASCLVPAPEDDFLLDGITRVGAKMLLNALSTCVMVRLGRVRGNCMVAVVPSNLKLIDRSIRYIQILTDLSYEDACYLLFESIEYVKSRMESGQSYPPPVALTVMRFECGCTLEEAEDRVAQSFR